MYRTLFLLHLLAECALIAVIFAANYFGIVTPVEFTQMLSEWRERTGKGAL